MRLHFTRVAAVLLLCGGFSWFVLASHPTERKNTYTEFYYHHDHILGTSLDLFVTARDENAADEAEQAVLAEIERLRRVFSLYDPNSELSRLNRTRATMVVSSEMIEVL